MNQVKITAPIDRRFVQDRLGLMHQIGIYLAEYIEADLNLHHNHRFKNMNNECSFFLNYFNNEEPLPFEPLLNSTKNLTLGDRATLRNSEVSNPEASVKISHPELESVSPETADRGSFEIKSD